MLPLMFMILLGIYWFGRAFNIYATINHAAREAARAGVAQSCATCSPGNVHLPPGSGVTIVDNVLKASSVDPTQIQAYTPPSMVFCLGLNQTSACSVAGSNGNILFCDYVQLTPVTNAGPPACGVVVSFQYPYQFWLPFTSLNMQQIVLKADVQMVGEY